MPNPSELERQDQPAAITDADLAAWQKLCDEATAGPWFAIQIIHQGVEGWDLVSGPDNDPSEQYSLVEMMDENDFRLMSAARTAMPMLISEVRKLQSLVHEMDRREDIK